MQEGRLPEVDVVAKRLSLEINCILRLPAFGKNVLVCGHGVPFSITRLRESSDWTWAKDRHDKAIH